jgi:hypothetical protein
MKIRFYKDLNNWRWIGFLLAMLGAFILSDANTETQWLGWAVAGSSGAIWIYMGYKDGDIPRTLMEVMYLAVACRAIYNWIYG